MDKLIAYVKSASANDLAPVTRSIVLDRLRDPRFTTPTIKQDLESLVARGRQHEWGILFDNGYFEE